MAYVISPQAKYEYIPGLDGIRALAVLLVMISHTGLEHILPGGFGVTVFFFVSGFLITRLLLAETQHNGFIALKAFYIRRFLRLMPALYAMIAVVFMGLWVLGNPPPLMELVTSLTYTMNYYKIWLEVNGIAQTGPWGHLWSLAVEEHFYLLFPLILILFKRSALKICIGLCMAALLWRLVVILGLGLPGTYNYFASETRLDSILYGCLLSLTLHHYGVSGALKKMMGLLPITLAGLLLVFCFLFRDSVFRETLRYTLQGIALFVIILNLYFHSPFSRGTKILEWPFLRWTGRISYGLYLWHIPVYLYLDQHTPIEFASPTYMVSSIALTYLVAALSFRFVETPVIGLRRKFGSHAKT